MRLDITTSRLRKVLLTAVLATASSLALTGVTPATATLVEGPENYLGHVEWDLAASTTNGAGDVAVAFQRRGNLFVRVRPAGGPWGRPELVARGAGEDFEAITLDGAGNPTVAWWGENLWVRTRTPAGWLRKHLLQRGEWAHAAMAENTAGDLAVLYLTSGGLRVAYRPASGGWRPPQVLFKGVVWHLSPRIGLDRFGRATAVWVQGLDRRYGLLHTARSGATGHFGAPETLSGEFRSPSGPDLAVDPSGDAAVVWVQDNPTSQDVLVRRRTARGSWTAAEALAAAAGADSPQIASGPRGELWAVWHEPLGGQWAVRTSRKPAGGTWADPVTLRESSERITDLDIASSRSGSAVVSYRVWVPELVPTRRLAMMRAASFDEPFLPLEQVSLVQEESQYWWSLSGAGDVLVTIASPYVPPTEHDYEPDPIRHLYAVALDLSGPVTTTGRPGQPFTRGRVVPVAWNAVDVWSAVAGYEVEERSATRDVGFGEWQPLVQGSTTRKDLLGSAGTTYCFRARGTDAVGNVGGWSDVRCSAVPLDDRDLARSGSWTAGQQDGAYRGTVLRTRTRSASLTTPVSTRRVALLATRRPGGGSVALYLDGARIGEVSLDARTVQSRRLLPVASFRKVRSGRLRIVVTSSGRPVLVDGLATSRR